MDTGRKSIIFNNYAQLSLDESMVYLYANDPIVRLEEGKPHPRNTAQIARLQGKPKLTDDPLFGTNLEWAYREYIVHLLSIPGDRSDMSLPLGLAPAQPISDPTRGKAPASQPHTELGQQQLYLFNVIVALEWYPSERYLQQLQWAFRRASDFLYDVTDGFMAFGQVVFGGPEMLDCADIQIMASNRLLPRSWVSGLHDEKKYMPIRAGRGIWHKNNRVTIPWDEPEAYRTLVHEWGHYALELRDNYLGFDKVDFAPGSSSVLIKAKDGLKTVVVPQISLALQSIMTTLEGTSELVPQEPAKSEVRKQNVWNRIKCMKHFPAQKKHQLLDGPNYLPLPLPRFRRIGALAGDGASAGPTSMANSAAAPEVLEELRFSVPDDIDAEHCWVYVLREPQNSPPSLIAQGTLDAQSEHDGFRLLGAKIDDQVVLIGQNKGGATVVLGNVITNVADGEPFANDAWQDLTPSSFPMIDVLPAPVNKDDPIAQISVYVTSDSGSSPDDVWVFPLGDPAGGQKLTLSGTSASKRRESMRLTVPTLDGHVLTRWGNKLVISTFSQGGGPATNTPVGPPPISAGSPEGNLMLFFQTNPAKQHTCEEATSEQDYSGVRVVTTVMHGMPNTLKDTGGQACSYAFSLAGTQPLPKDLNPTLILYYDTHIEHRKGNLLVYHQRADGKWKKLPTYCPPGASFAAVPLDDDQASGRLIIDEGASFAAAPQDNNPAGDKQIANKVSEQWIERYRLYWKLYDDSASE